MATAESTGLVDMNAVHCPARGKYDSEEFLPTIAQSASQHSRDISPGRDTPRPLVHTPSATQDAYGSEYKSNSIQRSSFSTENSEILSTKRRSSDTGYTSLQRRRGGSQAVDRMSRWVRNLKVKSRSSQFPPRINEGEEDVHPQGAIYGKSYETSQTVFTSSTGFVNKIRTATASVASLSYYTGGDAASRRVPRDRHSRQGSPSRSHRGSWDMATVRRAGERRKIIQEIISSEESYITDLKTLKAVYDRVIDTSELEVVESKASIKANILDLIELHERLLSSILNSFPSSSTSYSATDEGKGGDGSVVDILGLANGDGLAEPEAVMNLCEIFGEMLQKIFIYEEYAAHYNEMLTGFVGDHKACENWKTWEFGFEMLANSIHSSNSKAGLPGKKAVGLADLIVKPFQRICKYKLLFEEMLKYSPVIDCPESNFQLQRICKACKDTAATVDAIMSNDQNSKVLLRKTWIVRNLLALERARHLFDGIWPDLDMDFYRKLGRLNICSVLFVAWPSDDTIKGSYMACLLYKSYLMLANVVELQRYPSKLQFAIEFLIPLDNAHVQDAKNDEGVQCPNAPFTWKVQFEFSNYNYQVLLCARNAAEESEWRGQLKLAMETTTPDPRTPVALGRRHLHHRKHYSIASRPASLSVIPLGLRHLANDYEEYESQSAVHHRHRSLQSNLTTSCIEHCILYIYNTDDFSEARLPGMPPAEFAVASPCDLSLDAIANLKSTEKENRLTSEDYDALIYTLSPAREHRTKVDNLIASVWSRNMLKLDAMTRIKRLPSMSLHRTLTVVSGKSSSTDSGSTDGSSGLRKLSINSLSLRWGSRRRPSARTLTPVPQPEPDTEPHAKYRSPSACIGDITEPRAVRGRSSSYHFDSGPIPSNEHPPSHRRVTSLSQYSTGNYEGQPRMENEVPNSPHRRRRSLLARLSPEPIPTSKQTKAECWSVELSSKSFTESEKDTETVDFSQQSLDKFDMSSNTLRPKTPRGAKDSLKRLLLGI